ncbi:hypothetical protein K1719_010525 [Acacia pycnantha]|nr:hypothetical protein K1719_010525 [Acacia pycnantha]
MSKSFLADVDDSKDTWSVVAKVIRKWVVRKKAAPYPIWKIGMILADEMDTRMEVSATHKTVIPSLLDVPKEGIVYNFQNFEVVKNDDKYRATTNPWRLNFHNHTYIEESDVVINQQGYNFKSIVDVKHGINADQGLIDVIGFLQAFGRLQDQTRESDITKRLNFSIADENENIINITLWGQCAEETYAKKHEDMEPPVMVLVRFARTNRNTDYGHLSNAFNATLVTLNPKIPEASLLKERLSQDSTSSHLFSQISSLEYPTYSAESLLNFRTRITLSDISKLEQECDVVSKVTIKKCETLYGWFYDACPCDKKPEYMSNGTLRCTKCEKDVLMTVPKYKIHYKVVDETGKCSIIFFDRHATELLGKSASRIKEDMHKEGRNTTIPKELDEIAGKVVIVRLRIKSHNIKYRTRFRQTLVNQSSENEIQPVLSNITNRAGKYHLRPTKQCKQPCSEQSNSANSVRRTCDMFMRVNEMQTPQSTLINPSTTDRNMSVLNDITNQQGESNLNHTNTSALTEISTVENTTSVNPSSVSVNQHKLKKKSFNKICQVATDLSHRFEEPLSSLHFELNQDARDDAHGRRALLFCPFRPKPPSYRELIAPTGNRLVHHVNAENLDPTIVEMLKECLDKHNSIVKNYRKAGDIIKDNVVPDISIRLIRNSNSSMLSKQYNMPTTSEFAALIVGDFEKSYTKRDIIVKRQSGKFATN